MKSLKLTNCIYVKMVQMDVQFLKHKPASTSVPVLCLIVEYSVLSDLYLSFPIT